MKILDRYIAKNFLIGYVIAFCVLIGLRIIIELFVNLDEFAENAKDLGARGLMMDILTFYAFRTTLYFRDTAGVIRWSPPRSRWAVWCGTMSWSR